MKNILLLSASSSKDNTADSYLLSLLNKGLNKLKINSRILFVGDYIVSSPRLFQPVNIPFFLRELKKYSLILGWGFFGSYLLSFTKPYINAKTLCRVVGIPFEEARTITNNPFIQFETTIIQKIGEISSDYYITCSNNLKEYCIRKGIDKENIIVIRNSVDTNLFKPMDLFPDKENFVVLYAGGFQEYQGINNLIEAASLLKQYNIKFKIIGFKKNHNNVKKNIINKLNDKAELLNMMPRSELVKQINASNICIIPRENNIVNKVAFPTKFAEYISTGKPVITTNVGEISHYVKSYNCGYVCQSNAQSIADAILKAKDTNSNSILKKSLNARRLALKEFDNLKITRKYINFLNKISNNQ